MQRYIGFMKDFENPISAEVLNAEGFFTAPASTKYHGSYEGGLFDHSLAVAESLVEFTEKNNLSWTNERSPYIIGMFHDLCKTDSYFHNGEEYEHSSKTLLKGHGDKSIMMLSTMMQLTMEEVVCIRYHMGSYNTDEWDQYDKAIKSFPNVLWTHHADMYASKVIGV